MTAARRIVALVLPELPCELAAVGLRVPKPAADEARRRRRRTKLRLPRVPPLGVVLVEQERGTEGGEAEDATKATAVLDAVNAEARPFGVRAGQTVAEARALLARLVIREVVVGELRQALGRVAEMALAFGATAAIEAPDTVWLDVTGAAHLAGGEEALATELAGRVRAAGHVVRVAVSDGPLLARAFARWSSPRAPGSRRLRDAAPDPSVVVVPPADTVRCLAALPVAALPLDRERISWLMRLGVLSVGDLVRLPRAAAVPRLGPDSGRLLDWCEGRDDQPLVAYEPPATPVESSAWDEPMAGSEPLLFVLRGLVARMSARLEGRGEAAQAVDLVVVHDRAIARLEGAPAETRLCFDLATPLHREEDLRRVITSRLERARLPAPSVGLRLEVPAVTRALALQLDLVRGATGLGSPEALPVLLSELAADVGAERLGVLEVVDSHRPEARSVLRPALHGPRGPKKVRSPAEQCATVDGGLDEPTRLFSRPVRFDAPLRRGATVALDHRLFSIEEVRFERRIDRVEWWSSQPVSRDYYRVWLQGSDSGLEAVVYVDRESGERRLQALCD